METTFDLMQRDRLEKEVAYDPFDEATRLILADWLEEHGCWEHAAHRETVRVMGTPLVNDWDHPVSKLIVWLDRQEFKTNPIKPRENILTVKVCPFSDRFNVPVGWAVHPDTGYKYPDLDATEYEGWYFIEYSSVTQDGIAYFHPTLFYKTLIRSLFGKP